LKNPFHFIGIAGLGWLLDTAVFLAFVHALHGSPFAANFLGGLVGASLTFLLARERIFVEKRGRTWVRLAGYLTYTLGLLIVASAAVHWLAALIHHVYPPLPVPWAALAAKIIVTPCTLALNYCVAKLLNTR
jgi:putative flippase GtrA